MKKYNTIKVVLITMLVFLLLSWILPAAYYSGEYVEQGRVQMGLFDAFNYPLTALSYFGYIAFFIILVGGFYGVLYKIPAYRTLLDKIVEKAEGKEKVVLSIMIAIIALLVSICGLQIGVALFIPFIISIILLMGYDKIVAAFVTVGGICAGLIGSTYAYSNLSVLLETLSLKFNYQIGVRFVILLVGVVLVIFNTLMYIKKNGAKVKIEKKTIKKKEEIEEKVVEPVSKASSKTTTSSAKTSKGTSRNSSGSKNSKSSSKRTTKSTSKTRKSNNKAALKDEDIIVVKENMSEDYGLIPEATEKKHTIWPIVVLFSLLFLLLVLAFISWGDNGFGIKLFDDVTKSVQELKIFKFALFAKILGTFNSFGNWTLTDLFFPLFFVIFLLAIIYKVSMEDIFDGFSEGAKKALAPAVIVILVYSILVLVTYHPFQLVIYKFILGLAKGFNIATTVIVALLSSIFNVDIAYTFQSTVPYYVSIVTKNDSYSLVAIIFQTIYGLSVLVAPTSLILMGTLSYLKIPYGEWLKNVWKLFLEIFVVLLIIFIILAMI